MTTAKTITVLVADDQAFLRRSVCALLVADGRFTIVGEADDGRAAVKMARKLGPDVILMDIAMPRLNGLEATRQIIAADPSARVIMVSAYRDEEYVERATAIGAAAMLAKQTFTETLVETILRVLRGRSSFRPPRAPFAFAPGVIEGRVKLKIV